MDAVTVIGGSSRTSMSEPARSGTFRGRTTSWLLVATAALTSGVLACVMARGGDVAVYHAAGVAAQHGSGVYVFRVDRFGFTYPPFSALLFEALAALSVTGTWLVMNTLTALSLVGLLTLSVRDVRQRLNAGSRGTTALICLLVLSEPVVETFRYGQVDLLLVTVVMADLLVSRSGLFLGLATAVKLTPGIFIAFLLLRRRYREAATATAVFAVSVIGAAVVLPGDSRRYWLHTVLKGSGTGGFDRTNNQSVHGLLVRLVGEPTGSRLWLLTFLPVVAAGLYIACRAAGAGSDLLAVGVVGVTGCLVSPLSWNHAWVWLVPVVAGLADHDGCRRTARRAAATAAVPMCAWTFVPLSVAQLAVLRPIGTGYALLAVPLFIAVYRLSASRPPVAPPMGQAHPTSHDRRDAA